MNSISMHRLDLRMLVTTIAFLVCSPHADAQLAEFDRLGVADELRVLSGSLSIDSLPRLPEAKSEVVRAYDGMNQYLAAQASPENWAAWLKYVDANSMIEAINSGKESPRDLAELGRAALGVQQRLVGLAPGLERQALRNLRTAVDHLVAAIRHHDSEKSLTLIGKQMAAVADVIEKLDLINDWRAGRFSPGIVNGVATSKPVRKTEFFRLG